MCVIIALQISPTGRSKYDIIADIHLTAVMNAHFGPNFLPWHRLYLITYVFLCFHDILI